MHRESHEWWSPALGRSMRLLWYGREGRPILIFPTSMGHESQNEDLGLIGGVGDLIERGVVQACCVNASTRSPGTTAAPPPPIGSVVTTPTIATSPARWSRSSTGV